MSAFKDPNGADILLVRPGNEPAGQMIDRASSQETRWIWAGRAGGFALAWAAFWMFHPRWMMRIALGNADPPGRPVLIALTLAAPLTLLIMALATVVRDPPIAGALAVAGVVVFVVLRRSLPRPVPAI